LLAGKLKLKNYYQKKKKVYFFHKYKEFNYYQIMLNCNNYCYYC